MIFALVLGALLTYIAFRLENSPSYAVRLSTVIGYLLVVVGISYFMWSFRLFEAAYAMTNLIFDRLFVDVFRYIVSR